jgi:hypothetical protein
MLGAKMKFNGCSVHGDGFVESVFGNMEHYGLLLFIPAVYSGHFSFVLLAF